MRARVGDLAIARFDPENDDDIKAGKKWTEFVCLVIDTWRCGPNGKNRHHEFIYWSMDGTRCNINQSDLPSHRLIRARPKNDDWEGTLASLTLDSVEPVG
jgi:hypothetical protein